MHGKLKAGDAREGSMLFPLTRVDEDEGAGPVAGGTAKTARTRLAKPRIWLMQTLREGLRRTLPHSI